MLRKMTVYIFETVERCIIYLLNCNNHKRFNMLILNEIIKKYLTKYFSFANIMTCLVSSIFNTETKLS